MKLLGDCFKKINIKIRETIRWNWVFKRRSDTKKKLLMIKNSILKI